jgi:hypothetical protein
MKIDFSTIDVEQFMSHQHFVGEHPVLLVQPYHIGADWSKDNLIFRSSVWDMEGNPVSLSFCKFFNWGEKPHLTAPPPSLTNAKLMEKLDGSTLIFSRYKGHTVARTRGTVDAHNQDNGYEVDYLLEKYSKFKEVLESEKTSNKSYIFEWLSPTNRIVLSYGDEPDMVLVAVIFHDDYSMMTQDGLDVLASQLQLRRPRTFKYDSIEEMKAAIEVLRDQEGVCVYYNNDQNILKVKSAHYLYLHRAKSEISSIEKVIDVYMDWFITKRFVEHSDVSYTSFFAYLEEKFDYEIATMARGHASRICDAMKEVEKIMNALFKYAADCKDMSRKDAAMKIMQAYGSTGRSSIIFKLMDGKVVGKDDWCKILYQVLKD